MTRIAPAAVICLLTTLHTATAFAQSGTQAPPPLRTLSLDGPRFGFTMLSEGVRAKLLERNIAVEPMISQFGWQFERQFFTRDSGVTAMTEWVALLGGLDQGTPIPSLNWMVGLRTREGAEFGIGPNLTPAGVGLTLAAGVTFKAGALNVPMNFAVVPSRAGTRVSILTGFTMRR